MVSQLHLVRILMLIRFGYSILGGHRHRVGFVPDVVVAEDPPVVLQRKRDAPWNPYQVFVR